MPFFRLADRFMSNNFQHIIFRWLQMQLCNAYDGNEMQKEREREKSKIFASFWVLYG